MNRLETQVGQIYIIDKKLSRSFVSLLSERVPETGSEIFTLVEIPILNPSAWQEYEKLAKLIQMILRKNFRRDNENAFENSIAQINDELAQAAAAGQTAWVGKMNACLAVRKQNSLFIATCGKIHAFLLRDKQLADIADSPVKPNPLKTFENFAVGKIQRRDFLIFTTTQLFNYLSIERLKDIVTAAPLSKACQSIAEIIRNLADETISFGTFILEIGEQKDFENAEGVLSFTNPIKKNAVLDKSMAAAEKSVSLIKGFSAFVVNKARSLRGTRINLKDVRPALLKEKAKQLADIEKIKNLPRAKKFFLVSAAVFALLLIVNIFVAVHVSRANKQQAKIDLAFEEVRTRINAANSAYIYNDKQKAIEIINSARNDLAALQVNKKSQQEKNDLQDELTELLNTIGGLKTVDAEELAVSEKTIDQIESSDGNIYMLSLSKNSFQEYKKDSKQLGKTVIISAAAPVAISSNDDQTYYADNNGNIYQIDFSSGSAAAKSGKLNVSKGLAFYGSPVKAYTADPSSNSVNVSVLNNDASPSNYLKQSTSLNGVMDIAIDGSIYLLFPDKIRKFTSGQERAFSNPGLQYSDRAKIYANNSWKYIYVLDPQENKLVVLDKNGNIKTQYTSTKFNDLKDVIINEAAKEAIFLNGNALLRVQLSI